MAYKPVGADENGQFPPRVVTKLDATYASIALTAPVVANLSRNAETTAPRWSAA